MGKFFGVQILGIVAILLWTVLISGGYFLLMRNVFGIFRIDKSIEIIGLDIAEMGGLSNEMFDKILKDNVSRKNSFMSSPFLSHMSPSNRSRVESVAKNINNSVGTSFSNDVGSILRNQKSGAFDIAKSV